MCDLFHVVLWARVPHHEADRLRQLMLHHLGVSEIVRQFRLRGLVVDHGKLGRRTDAAGTGDDEGFVREFTFDRVAALAFRVEHVFQWHQPMLLLHCFVSVRRKILLPISTGSRWLWFVTVNRYSGGWFVAVVVFLRAAARLAAFAFLTGRHAAIFLYFDEIVHHLDQLVERRIRYAVFGDAQVWLYVLENVRRRGHWVC